MILLVQVQVMDGVLEPRSLGLEHEVLSLPELFPNGDISKKPLRRKA